MVEFPSRPFEQSLDGPFKSRSQDSRTGSDIGLVILPEQSKCIGFFGQQFLLMRQKQSWSPTVIAGQFWRYLINIDMRREVLHLLKLRPYAEIVRNNPRFSFKYLATNYLGRGLTVKERASCFLHHHRFMYAALPERVLLQILQGDVTLHEIAKDNNRFSVSIGSPERVGDREGELALNIQVDAKKVFNLSFTIIPGWVVQSEAAQVLLITRLQGTSGCRSEIRLARRALHEFFPGKLLLAALQGIADAFGVCELWAICGAMQRAYSQKYSAMFESCYDDFFANLGMTRTTAGFYSISFPIDYRHLASFKGRNRLRAKKRRAMRQQIQTACAACLLGASDRVAAFSSGVSSSTLTPGNPRITVQPPFLSRAERQSNSLT